MKKGLASFEFLVILGLILLVTSTIITDSLAQSKRTMALSTSKSIVLKQIEEKSLSSTDCFDPRIDSFEVNGDNLTFSIVPSSCQVEASKVADSVESEICGVQPDHNQVIVCGGKQFEVNIE